MVSHGVVESEPSSMPQQVEAPLPDSESAPSPGTGIESAQKPASPSEEPLSARQPEKAIASDILAQSADEASLPWTLEDVFFEFDQFVIRPDAIRVLEQNAKVLMKRYPERELILQGHCDEFGTEEYNLILGERRATAVKNFLKDLGVPADNMRVLSLGKTQPFCLARTIECFWKNRRVHFVFK